MTKVNNRWCPKDPRKGSCYATHYFLPQGYRLDVCRLPQKVSRRNWLDYLLAQPHSDEGFLVGFMEKLDAQLFLP